MKDARAGKWLEGLKKYLLAALAALLGIVLMLLPEMRRPSQQPAVRTPRRSTAARCRRRWRTSCAPSTAWASCG